MLNVLRAWVDRYFSDEEALLLAILLAFGLVIILTIGVIIAPLLTGIVFAFVLQGVIKFLTRRHVAEWAAVALTYLLFLSALAATLVFVIPNVLRQLRALFDEAPEMLAEMRELLTDLPNKYPAFVSADLISGWSEMLQGEAGNIGQWLLSASISQLPLLVTVVVYLLLVPILVFFFLKDKDDILRWTLSFLPRERPLLDRIGLEMNLQMANYVRGKFLEIIIAGSATYVVFATFDLDYAALLGLLVGLSVIVPYVGIAVVTVPVLLIAYLQFGFGATFAWILLWYTLVQALDGFVLVPVLFSEAVNLHPVAIIAAILVFGSLGGLWGVFFAIPLATLIKAIIYAWPQSGTDRESDPA